MKKKKETEKFRKFFNMQYVKIKQLAAVGALLLLAFNLSLSIYPFIEFRFQEYYWFIPREYILIPLLWFLIMLSMLLCAHIWVRKFHMYRTEKRAETTYNPYTVYAFTPFQEMYFRHVYLPFMKSNYSLMPDSNEKTQLLAEISMVSNWVKLGYIPKKDFPKHLKKYYLADFESRL